MSHTLSLSGSPQNLNKTCPVTPGQALTRSPLVPIFLCCLVTPLWFPLPCVPLSTSPWSPSPCVASSKHSLFCCYPWAWGYAELQGNVTSWLANRISRENMVATQSHPSLTSMFWASFSRVGRWLAWKWYARVTCSCFL